MSDCNNNNIVSVERDICTGIGKNTIHQLNKLDEKLGKRKRVRIYPITYIQAVYDAKTGTRLDNFLNMVNSIYLPWRGTAKSTRLQVPYHLRRKGLMISYQNIDNEIITEKCIYCIKDDLFKLDSSWVRITDALPVSGNVTIGSNGNWFVDGEDTGFKAQGPKGDNGQVPYLKLGNGYIQYSYDEETWYELLPIIDITPAIAIGEVETLPSGSKATVSNSSSGKDAVLNFGIPMGNTGAKGEKGDGWEVKGWVDNAEALPSTGTLGDLYIVGTTQPYSSYVWKDSVSTWVNIGSVTEIKASVFDGGRADSKYGGTRTIDCGGADAFVTNSVEGN